MKDPKKLNIPNICFSLLREGDKREKEFSEQRIKTGFDDSETWSLRDTIGNFILPRLKRFKDVRVGYPSSMNENEWNDKLEKMITAFILLTRDKGSFILNGEEEKQYEEGINLFHKHFLDLWW